MRYKVPTPLINLATGPLPVDLIANLSTSESSGFTAPDEVETTDTDQSGFGAG